MTAYRAGWLVEPPTKVSRVFKTPADNTGSWIYYHLATDRSVLYIGKTNNPAARTRSHDTGSDWFGDVADLIWFGPMDEVNATAVERELISVEQPPNNVRHTDREVHASQTPEARLRTARARVERMQRSLARAEENLRACEARAKASA